MDRHTDTFCVAQSCHGWLQHEAFSKRWRAHSNKALAPSAESLAGGNLCRGESGYMWPQRLQGLLGLSFKESNSQQRSFGPGSPKVVQPLFLRQGSCSSLWRCRNLFLVLILNACLFYGILLWWINICQNSLCKGSNWEMLIPSSAGITPREPRDLLQEYFLQKSGCFLTLMWSSAGWYWNKCHWALKFTFLCCSSTRGTRIQGTSRKLPSISVP